MELEDKDKLDEIGEIAVVEVTIEDKELDNEMLIDVKVLTLEELVGKILVDIECPDNVASEENFEVLLKTEEIEDDKIEENENVEVRSVDFAKDANERNDDEDIKTAAVDETEDVTDEDFNTEVTITVAVSIVLEITSALLVD